MGLLDRFKKNKADEKASVDALVKKSDNLLNALDKQEKAMIDDVETIKNRRTERATKEYQYKALNSRVSLLSDLCNDKKIRLTREAGEKMHAWIKMYKEQMSNFDYKDIYATDLDIPEFPVKTTDVYCHKNSFMVYKVIEALLNPDDLYRSGQEIISSFEQFFAPIKDSDELISVHDGLIYYDIMQGNIPAKDEIVQKMR